MKALCFSETSQTERQIPCDLTYMWNLKKPNQTKPKTPKLIDTENRLLVASSGRWAKMKVVIRYKLLVNKSWGYMVQHGDYS